jgi:hypothetical protein
MAMPPFNNYVGSSSEKCVKTEKRQNRACLSAALDILGSKRYNQSRNFPKEEWRNS